MILQALQRDIERSTINQQIRSRDEIEPDRTHAFADLVGKAVMVAKQMEARLQGGEDLVDLYLAGVGPAIAVRGPERLRGFVRQEDVEFDAAKSLTLLDFLAHEMAPLVGEHRGFRRPLPGMREVGCRRVVPSRGKRSAETQQLDNRLAGVIINLDDVRIADVIEIARQITRGNRVEVVVVAVNPVDIGAERFVAAVLVRDVADTEPERNIGMARDDRARGVELAVDVAERAEAESDVAGSKDPAYFCAGTSRSVLSQMKSLLL